MISSTEAAPANPGTMRATIRRTSAWLPSGKQYTSASCAAQLLVTLGELYAEGLVPSSFSPAKPG